MSKMCKYCVYWESASDYRCVSPGCPDTNKLRNKADRSTYVNFPDKCRWADEEGKPPMCSYYVEGGMSAADILNSTTSTATKQAVITSRAVTDTEAEITQNEDTTLQYKEKASDRVRRLAAERRAQRQTVVYVQDNPEEVKVCTVKEPSEAKSEVNESDEGNSEIKGALKSVTKKVADTIIDTATPGFVGDIAKSITHKVIDKI